MTSMHNYVGSETIVTCPTYLRLVARKEWPYETHRFRATDLAVNIKQVDLLNELRSSKEPLWTSAQVSTFLEEHIEGNRQLLEGPKCYNFFPVAGNGWMPVLAIVYKADNGEWRKLAWDPTHDELLLPKGSRLFRTRT